MDVAREPSAQPITNLSGGTEYHSSGSDSDYGECTHLHAMGQLAGGPDGILA